MTTGWLQPLLARIAEKPTAVVCPVIDIINDDNFSYVKSFSLHWGAFNWELHFRYVHMNCSILWEVECALLWYNTMDHSAQDLVLTLKVRLKFSV